MRKSKWSRVFGPEYRYHFAAAVILVLISAYLIAYNGTSEQTAVSDATFSESRVYGVVVDATGSATSQPENILNDVDACFHNDMAPGKNNAVYTLDNSLMNSFNAVQFLLDPIDRDTFSCSQFRIEGSRDIEYTWDLIGVFTLDHTRVVNVVRFVQEYHFRLVRISCLDNDNCSFWRLCGIRLLHLHGTDLHKSS